MDLTEEVVNKYRDLHEKQFNERLDFEYAEQRLKELVRFYLLVSRPLPKKSKSDEKLPWFLKSK